MPNKTSSEIKQLTLNDATFHAVEIPELTLVNFFYGNNGSGKSTVGRAIKGGDRIKSTLRWREGRSDANYRKLVYNSDYIAKLISNSGDIPGVFTFHTAEDEKIELEIAQIEPAKKAYMDKVDEIKAKLTEMDRIKAGRTFSYKEIFWQTTESIRQRFSKYISGLQRNKDTFMDKLLTIAPRVCDPDELEHLCATAFDKNSRTYELIHPIEIPQKIKDIESSELLSKKIVSRADTPFAEYMKAIEATSWVREGHEHFAHTPGEKCPYCQQKLPDDFEAQLAACFDKQYQEELQSLQKMATEYRNFADGIIRSLQSSFENRHPNILVESFESYMSVITTTLEMNCDEIDEKVADPTLEIHLKDCSSFIDSINREIADYNSQIEKNNAIVTHRNEGKRECENALWGYMAYIVHESADQYRDECLQHDATVRDLKDEGNKAWKDGRALQDEIDRLRSQTGNTIDAMKSINTILDDTGFQGFRLTENPDVKNHYHLIRPGQDKDLPADNLSEGERNFIAFLYFYHEVKGSNTKTNETPDKIVVIDDPVSSMDSQVLFVVSALVRELVEVCLNNVREPSPETREDYIKQMFLFTHNTFYHRQLTHDYVGNYEAVSFYRIHKEDNISGVEYCWQWHPTRPSEKMNRNPVEDAYATLWREYQEVKSCTALMSVIRQILEYYFLQLSCYKGTDLRRRILDDNKTRFLNADGSFDAKSHRLARTMLAYIYAGSIGFNDGLNYVDEGFDPDKMRTTFKLIFDIMEQPQHYKMMIENTQVK